MNRHIATLASVIAIGKQLAHEVLQSKSSLLEDTSFTVLSEHHIIWGESRGRTDCDTFLAS
jgi:hypothetical protein